MSKTHNHHRDRRYRTETFGKSLFDDNPTLTLNHYWTPKIYQQAVADVIAAYRHGIPFNKAVDQVHALDPKHLNRNKLAEHALKTIANDF